MLNSWCNSARAYCFAPRLTAGTLLTVSVLALLFPMACSVRAEAVKPVTEVPATSEIELPPRQTSVSEQFCAGIVDRAADFRFAQQRAELSKLHKTIEERLQQLERKRSEFETWIKRREDFLSMVQGNLSAIYMKMKPAAAAEQLAKIDDMTAAAILLKLDPRATSAILSEMDPTKAADLARLFAAAGRNKSSKGS